MKTLLQIALIILSLVFLSACSPEETPVVEELLAADPPETPAPSEVVPSPTIEPTQADIFAMIKEVINDVSTHTLPDTDWLDAQVDMKVYIGGGKDHV